MKVRNSLEKICPKCIIVLREGVQRVICKSSPKHKQRQKGGVNK